MARGVKGNRKGFHEHLRSKEDMGLLLIWAGDMMIKDKAEALNAFFASVFRNLRPQRLGKGWSKADASLVEEETSQGKLDIHNGS